MTTTDYDVVIVGASLAGCAAAIHYGRRGARVALLDRNPDPRAYKVVCSTYIQAGATPAIKRLGLAERIEAAGGVRNGIDIWTRWGWIRPQPGGAGPATHGYNIRRETLDPMLREMAAETPGVELMLGHTARGLLMHGRRATGVETTGPAGGRSLSARLVVAADGRGSRVADLPGKRRPHGRYAYVVHYRDLPLTSGSRSQMWLLEPDCAYAFPHNDGITMLACMPAHERRAEFKRDPVAALERMFEKLPSAPQLAGARRVSKAIGKIDMTNVSRPVARPGLAFVGDAAMVSDPLWGVGCGFAFQSAEWLVECTGDAVVSGEGIDAGLRRYRRLHRRELAGHHWQTSDFATGRPFNPLERLMWSAAARDAASAAHFHAFGARQIKFSQFLAPRAVARAAAVNMRWREAAPASVVRPEGAHG